MIDKAVLDSMNEQIKHELYSAYFYLSMSAYCESANLHGFANWLSVQAGEEQGHASTASGCWHEKAGIHARPSVWRTTGLGSG